jgi:hypothetical protein
MSHATLDTTRSWILEGIAVYGFVAPGHLVKQFGLSARQASAALADVARQYPSRLRYNRGTRQYEGRRRAIRTSRSRGC